MVMVHKQRITFYGGSDMKIASTDEIWNKAFEEGNKGVKKETLTFKTAKPIPPAIDLVSFSKFKKLLKILKVKK
jgi:hypothetical protein